MNLPKVFRPQFWLIGGFVVGALLEPAAISGLLFTITLPIAIIILLLPFFLIARLMSTMMQVRTENPSDRRVSPSLQRLWLALTICSIVLGATSFFFLWRSFFQSLNLGAALA